MSNRTRFSGYTPEVDLSSADWIKRLSSAATGKARGIKYEFIGSAVSTANASQYDFADMIPGTGVYLIAAQGHSFQSGGVAHTVAVGHEFGIGRRSAVSPGPIAQTLQIINVQAFTTSTITVFAATSNRMAIAVWKVTGGLGLLDDFTVSLLHFNNFDTATEFFDETGKTWTPAGNAQIDTSALKFGGGSGLFDGTGDFISTPDSPDFTLGSGDFTIDAWFNCNAATGSARAIAGQGDDSFTAGVASWLLRREATTDLMAFYHRGAGGVILTGTTQFTDALNTGWHHIAIVRSGDDWFMFIDGVLEDSANLSTAMVDSANDLYIGIRSATQDAWLGWIDEFRFSVGIARWTTAFTPPTSEYGILQEAESEVFGTPDALAVASRTALLGVASSIGVDDNNHIWTGIKKRSQEDIDTTEEFTKILLHFDGVDASTTFTDSSSSPHTFTPAGNAQIDTAQSKFGGASGLFDGTGDWISTPDSPDFTLGSNDFTIDLWFNCTAVGGADAEIACHGDTGNANLTAWLIDRTAANVIRCLVSDGSTFAGAVSGTTQFTNLLNTGWHHLAVVRTGDILKLFIDGVQEGSDDAFTGAVNDTAQSLFVGSRNTYAPWTGWLDEFRLSVGIARWTEDFIPPTSAHSISNSEGVSVQSIADQLIVYNDGVTSQDVLVTGSEEALYDRWLVAAIPSAVPYFPEGSGATFRKQTSSANTFWAWTQVAPTADVELLGLFRVYSDSEFVHVGLMARGSGAAGSESGYTFMFSQSAEGAHDRVLITKNVGSATVTAVGSAATFAWDLETNYWMRFRVRGSTLQARIWEDGDPEPTTWILEETDTDVTAAGYSGIFHQYLGTIFEVGHFEATTLYPAWTDTLPDNWEVSISGGPQSNKISFVPDVGPSIDRRRSSHPVRNYQVTAPGFSQEEYLDFVEFYHTTLVEGTLPFMHMDPFTGVEKTFKFGSGDPAYTEELMRPVDSDYASGLYKVSFTVSRLD